MRLVRLLILLVDQRVTLKLKNDTEVIGIVIRADPTSAVLKRVNLQKQKAPLELLDIIYVRCSYIRHIIPPDDIPADLLEHHTTSISLMKDKSMLSEQSTLDSEDMENPSVYGIEPVWGGLNRQSLELSPAGIPFYSDIRSPSAFGRGFSLYGTPESNRSRAPGFGRGLVNMGASPMRLPAIGRVNPLSSFGDYSGIGSPRTPLGGYSGIGSPRTPMIPRVYFDTGSGDALRLPTVPRTPITLGMLPGLRGRGMASLRGLASPRGTVSMRGRGSGRGAPPT